MDRKRVGIVIYPDVEVLDFCGPFEVFSACRLDEARRREEPSPFEVVLAAISRDPVITAGGMKVLPDYELEECPALDVLVVPGGWGTRREMGNERLVGWLAARGQEVENLASVCTGAFLLARAGLLVGRRVTTHWRALDFLNENFPGLTVIDTEHVVVDGHVLTSSGISAGIDLALHIVARYHGEPIARATALHMEYPYPSDNRRRTNPGELAVGSVVP